jgi:putative ABC transport system ATP-binding protein
MTDESRNLKHTKAYRMSLASPTPVSGAPETVTGGATSSAAAESGACSTSDTVLGDAVPGNAQPSDAMPGDTLSSNVVPSDAMLRAQDVHRRYRTGTEEVHAVRGVSLSIAAGEFVAIVGASGSGKSTLLHLFGAVDAPSAGRIMFEGRDISQLSDADATRLRLTRMGFVFQRFYLMPTLSALENVALPMAEAGVGKAERLARAQELLTYVGLGARGAHRPAQLSGGEQQRVAVARALANKPALLLADEPTGELDAATGTALIDLLHQLNRDGLTCVLVTHDEALAKTAHRVVTMRDGQVVSDVRIQEPRS